MQTRASRITADEGVEEANKWLGAGPQPARSVRWYPWMWMKIRI
jgi:hypothetical protein